MRADRLLSLLMLLQTNGRTTARVLAKELEVSERTIYRDIQALSTSGVPIYTDRGPAGGIALIENYRTSLTGLTRDEVRALFMLSIPVPLAELGMEQELKTALRKLSAALPSSMWGDRELVQQRIYIDPVGWDPSDEPVPHLSTIQSALWEDQLIYIRYRSVLGARNKHLEALVQPYGLVAKAGAWNLVCVKQDHFLVIPLARILEARTILETFIRSENFDLAHFWKSWCADIQIHRPSYRVRARISPQILPFLPRYFGAQIAAAIENAGKPDEDGWYTLELNFEYLEEARERLLGFGGAVEVLEPLALRMSVLDYARQIDRLYSQSHSLSEE